MTNAIKHYARFRTPDGICHGEVLGDRVQALDGAPFGTPTPTGTEYPLATLDLLCPVVPPKILCVGRNYKSHLGHRAEPPVPAIFYKPGTSLQHPGGSIVIPPDARDLHYEGELVIVIGRGGKNIPEDEALDHVFGYTCGNDVSERNWQHGSLGGNKDVQWWRAKGCDTFAPLGPWITTEIDYATARLECRVNGEVKQSQLISDMIFPPARLISFISRYITIEQGDVIYTGTPGATEAMQPGDQVTVTIDGIGTLENPVVAA